MDADLGIDQARRLEDCEVGLIGLEGADEQEVEGTREVQGRDRLQDRQRVGKGDQPAATVLDVGLDLVVVDDHEIGAPLQPGREPAQQPGEVGLDREPAIVGVEPQAVAQGRTEQHQ